MSGLYNKPFKIGVAVTVFSFLLLNIISYFIARRRYDAEYEAGNLFLVQDGPVRWGFPFAMFNGSTVDEMIGITLNFIVVTICGVVVGFTTRLLFRSR